MEIQAKLQKKENLRKCDNSKLPDYLKDLTEGDTLKIKSQEDLKAVGVTEDDPIYYLSGRGMVAKYKTIEGIEEGNEYPAQIRINPRVKSILSESGYKGKELVDDDYINIRLEHLEYAIAKTKEEKKVQYSLVKEYTEDDIKEMISKVDKETLRKQFQIPMAVGRKPIPVPEEILDMYLDKWARAKVYFYLAFGRELTISKKIEYAMEENEMTCLINELIRKYPKYALNLVKIPPVSFVDNKLPRIQEFKTYFGDAYSEGMKVSKFFSSFKDPEFDNDISTVMQERMVKGFLTLSIDPYDYMTHAISMHGWGSCHSPVSGCHPTASFVYMIDPSNIVAYKHNGKEYLYDKGMYSDAGSMKQFDFKKNAFSGNSKSFRQLISVDVNTASMIFSREYPKRTTSDDLRKQVREITEELFANYLGIANEWDNYGAELSKYEAKFTEHYYSDIQNYNSLRSSYGDTVKMDYVTVHNSDISKSKVVDGARVYCLKCGKELHGSSVLCEDCGNH